LPVLGVDDYAGFDKKVAVRLMFEGIRNWLEHREQMEEFNTSNKSLIHIKIVESEVMLVHVREEFERLFAEENWDKV